MSDDNKVIEFNKRFNGETPTVKKAPIWNITYVERRTKDEDVNVMKIVEGYIFTHMPFFVVTEKEVTDPRLDPNLAVFCIPDNRLVHYHRVQEVSE